MRVLMVSGSWPPEPCGVGHYASMLSTSLEEGGIEVVRFGAEQALNVRYLHRTLAQLRDLAPDLIHLQYPTMAYGRSIGPPLFAMLARSPIIVTLHEFKSFRFYRLPWFLTYALCADALVFTTAFEREDFLLRLRRVPVVNEIIPIGSNVPSGPAQARKPRSVCYFGLIMPDKGLEQFIELMQLLAGQGFTFTVIGSIPQKWFGYGEQIVTKIRSLGGHMVMNETPDVIAMQLRRHSYAYLPFPDGATDKRGSLLAALVNRLNILTPLTDKSRPPITDCVVHAGSPREAASLLRAFVEGRRNWEGSGQFDAVAAYEWHTIARRHLLLYETVLTRRKCARLAQS
jgi:glycosyltransferase involved in cell wall biosynthesis